jgi:hypothetical protein
MLPDAPRPYNLGLTAASLRPELARIVAEQYLEAESWEKAKNRVLSANALQAGSRGGAERLEREFRRRLELLSDAQLTLLARSTSEDGAAMTWLAVAKKYAFAAELAAEILRQKVESGDPVLRPSDYESYVEEKAAMHPEIGKLTALTRGKIRRVLMRMLAEAGLIGPGRGGARPIQRPVLSPEAIRLIAADDPGWLAAFLVPDQEIEHLRQAMS